MRTGHPRPGSPAAASAARRGGPSSLHAVLAALLTVVALAGPAAAVANASTFDDIYADYRRSQTIDPCAYTAGQLRAAKRKLGSDAEQYAPEFPAALDRAIAGRGACKGGSAAKTPAAAKTGTGGASGSGTTGTTGAGTTGAGASGSSGTTTGGAAATPALPTVTTTPGQAPAPGATTEAAPATPAPAAVSTPAAAAQDDAIAAAAETPARDDDPEAWTWAVLAGAIVLAALLGWALVNATGRVEWLAPIGHSMGEAGWRISLRWAEFRDWLRFGSGR